ncbi:hypothetical protein IF1G_06114 [Cordyceps javanica]|uniref:Uncharacterized protein n=1 Tax=Cordyceps javanica TaxID=43265 RepID=A0A545V0A3_9HYPO|nr:hypothetical protein IF1G_06114 [Cordyceps javanica]TQW05670.1 hypothetical protein IF2G_06792 [Cordyceps javanica]
MAVAVAHAFIRTIRERFAEAPASTSTSSSESPHTPSVVTPRGLILEAHQDADDARRSRRRRSSSPPNSGAALASQNQQPRPRPRPPGPLDSCPLYHVGSSSSASASATSPSQPLSLAAAVVGLIAACHHTCHDAQDINVAPRGATAGVQTLRLALQSLKLTAQLAYKWLRRVEAARALPFPDRPALVELDALVVLIAEAVEAVSEAGRLLVDVVGAATAGAARVSDVAPAYAPALIDGSERIERVESLLSKLLIILQISSLDEALSARSTIDTALPLILGDNGPLAESIRCMPDVFSARALVDPARLAAILARPPPGYSVPTPSGGVSGAGAGAGAGDADDAPPYYSAATTAGGPHPDGSVTIRPAGWSVFASLTLADLCVLSLIPLPLPGSQAPAPPSASAAAASTAADNDGSLGDDVADDEDGGGNGGAPPTLPPLLCYGQFYTEAFAQRVGPPLAELMERPARAKAAQLAALLGSRGGEGGGVAMTDEHNFARRVGLELENGAATTRDGRPRMRPQPNVIIGGGP